MFMHRIKLENILSFGPEAQDLELRPLNVLIGPNGSGKSNLIEVIGLLKAATDDIMAPVREGGGGDNWMCRNEREVSEARVGVDVELPFIRPKKLLRYSLAFGPFFLGTPNLREEIGEVGETERGDDSSELYVKRRRGEVTVTYRDESGKRSQRELNPTDVEADQSILSQLKDPTQYPELTFVGMELARMRLYREWSLGRNTPPRLPQKADLPNRFLSEDARNLGMVLNRFEGNPDAKKKFLTALRKLYRGIDDYFVQIEAGTVQVFLREGNVPISATRLSDGTLRYLCLLAVLCNPALPSLVCIEEPELGLHPDILPSLADLLREASERCQLIVTTHSDILVDALTETPESIIICEKENGQTKLERLNKDELSHWLEKYRLGELWTSGELGGTRW
ncbi:MAG: AAA family ATPase [Defluviicoccus sp.]|nr:AAA family ATPase [Defluviicoccus sp.]MDE0276831.1 AAA family ATPase [Defluviicoccus sp.]